MTDIKKYTNHIRTAIYGKEVRESLATGIEVINAEVENNTAHVNKTVKDIEQFKSDIDSAERKRVSNENVRIANEETRKEEFKKIVDKNGTWDKKLSDLYNTNNSSLDSLNTNLNALHKNFKSKYDNLEREYAQDITDIKDVQGRLDENYKIDSLGIHPSSNGYIQDIKLTGKSLVNLIKIKDPFTGSGITAYTRIVALKNLEVNKTYTYIPLNVPSFIKGMYLGNSTSTETLIKYTTDIKPTTFTVTHTIELDTIMPHFYSENNTNLTTEQRNELTQKAKLMILEGDYTKNPPSYFEGLKSVGDGVENIEITTIKADNNLFNLDECINGKYVGSKKKLLYYDSNAKVWEKPILRKWDTIEKHVDGKYYYHKRSVKEVLDGTQDVTLNDSSSTNTNRFLINRLYPNQEGVNIDAVCDKYIFSNTIYEKDIKGIYISSPSGHLYIRDDKITPEELKKRFKSNPVTIVYKLYKEEIYECLDISVRSFNPKTLFSISSGINPRVDAYMPNSLISSDYSICNKIDSLDLDYNYKFKKFNEFTSNISQSIKNIFNKLKELTDVQISISENGYLKFPTLFGGILLQWGRAYIEPSTNKGRRMVTVNYPVSFNDKCYSIQLNPCALGDENGYDLIKDIYIAQGASSDIPNNNFTVIFDYKGTNIGADIRWFAIGK